jgi:hypothetical protein
MTIEASVDFYPLMDDKTNFGIYFTYNDNSRVGMGIMGGWYQAYTDFPQTYTIEADGYNAIDKNGVKVALLDQP